MNDTTWREHVLTGLAPAGTTQVRVGVRVDDVMTNVDIPFQTANFDDFSLIAMLPGDYNDNGIVDAADYTVWRDNLGTNVTLPNDDTPGVSFNDYEQWKTHFGESGGSGSGAVVAVPEPATALLIILAAVGLSTRRR